MKLTTTISLSGEPTALLSMIRQFNFACNALSQIAFSEQLFHWLPLQRRAYYWLRSEFGLTASQATVAVRKVAYAYRNKARRGTLATFKSLGAIPLFKHVYYEDGTVRFYGIRTSYTPRQGVSLPRHPKEGMLLYREGRLFIHQGITVEEPASFAPEDFLGCDLGIVNILADSEGETYSGGKVNGLRHRHAKLRARLQSKSTRSARRLLQKRRRREGRFSRDVNHCISKRVVAKAKRHHWGIALEDLRGIRGRTRVRKAQQRQHHSWAFFQLRFFIEYKARLQGVPVVFVNPRNSSRTCPECGFVSKANRPSQSLFSCVQCSFAGNADTIAAVNIARRAVDGRAAGDQPYAPPEREMSQSLALKG